MSQRRCYYCERTFTRLCRGEVSGEPGIIRTKDHIVPLSQGGRNIQQNIVNACYRCNHLKSDMSLDAFAAKCLRAGLPLAAANALKLQAKIRPYVAELVKDNYVPTPQYIRPRPPKLKEIIASLPPQIIKVNLDFIRDNLQPPIENFHYSD